MAPHKRKEELPHPLPRITEDAFFLSAPPIAGGVVDAMIAAMRGGWQVQRGIPCYVHVAGHQHAGFYSRTTYFIGIPAQNPDNPDNTAHIEYAHLELAERILETVGPETCLLHMLFLAHAAYTKKPEAMFRLTREQIVTALGYKHRTDLTAGAVDEICLRHVRTLRAMGIYINELSIRKKGRRKSERIETVTTGSSLWDIAFHAHKGVFPYECAGLKLEGSDWWVTGRPGLAWRQVCEDDAHIRMIGRLSARLFQNANRHNVLGMALCLKLLFMQAAHGSKSPGAPLRVTVQDMLDFAKIDYEDYRQNRHKRYELKNKIQNAILEAQEGGWRACFLEWPWDIPLPTKEHAAKDMAAPRGYWARLPRCVVRFYPPSELTPAIDAEAETAAAVDAQEKKPGALPAPAHLALTGGALRRLRRLRGLTQKAMGALLGCSQGMIAHYEANRRRIPAKTVARLYKHFPSARDAQESQEED